MTLIPWTKGEKPCKNKIAEAAAELNLQPRKRNELRLTLSDRARTGLANLLKDQRVSKARTNAGVLVNTEPQAVLAMLEDYAGVSGIITASKTGELSWEKDVVGSDEDHDPPGDSLSEKIKNLSK